MEPVPAALRAFRQEVASALLGTAWQRGGRPEADERLYLDTLAAPGFLPGVLSGPLGAGVRAVGFDPGVQLLVEVLRLEELGVGPSAGWLRPRGGGSSRAFAEVLALVAADKAEGVQDRIWAELGRALSSGGIPAAYRPILVGWLRSVATRTAIGPPLEAPEPPELHRLRALSEMVLHTPDPIPLNGAAPLRLSVDVEASLDPHARFVRAWIRPSETTHPPPIAPDVWIRLHQRSGGASAAWPWRPLPAPPVVWGEVLAIPAGAALGVELRVALR